MGGWHSTRSCLYGGGDGGGDGGRGRRDWWYSRRDYCGVASPRAARSLFTSSSTSGIARRELSTDAIGASGVFIRSARTASECTPGIARRGLFTDDARPTGEPRCGGRRASGDKRGSVSQMAAQFEARSLSPPPAAVRWGWSKPDVVQKQQQAVEPPPPPVQEQPPATSASSSWMSSAAVVGYTSLAAVALEEAFSAPAPSPAPNEPMEVEAVEEDEELSDAISKEDSDGHPAEEVVEWSSIPVMMPHGETKQVAARTTRIQRREGKYGIGLDDDNRIVELKPGCSAIDAGIEIDDRIISVDNIAITSQEDLVRAFEGKDEVEVVVAVDVDGSTEEDEEVEVEEEAPVHEEPPTLASMTPVPAKAPAPAKTPAKSSYSVEDAVLARLQARFSGEDVPSLDEVNPLSPGRVFSRPTATPQQPPSAASSTTNPPATQEVSPQEELPSPPVISPTVSFGTSKRNVSFGQSAFERNAATCTEQRHSSAASVERPISPRGFESVASPRFDRMPTALMCSAPGWRNTLKRHWSLNSPPTT